MATDIYTTFSSRLLDKEYSYEYNGNNLGSLPLKNFTTKIIISIDRSNPLFENTPLKEYVNIASNSVFLRASRQYDIVNAPDSTELIEYNKKNMSMTMPDLSVYNNKERLENDVILLIFSIVFPDSGCLLGMDSYI